MVAQRTPVSEMSEFELDGGIQLGVRIFLNQSTYSCHRNDTVNEIKLSV